MSHSRVAGARRWAALAVFAFAAILVPSSASAAPISAGCDTTTTGQELCLVSATYTVSGGAVHVAGTASITPGAASISHVVVTNNSASVQVTPNGAGAFTAHVAATDASPCVTAVVVASDGTTAPDAAVCGSVVEEPTVVEKPAPRKVAAVPEVVTPPALPATGAPELWTLLAAFGSIAAGIALLRRTA